MPYRHIVSKESSKAGCRVGFSLTYNPNVEPKGFYVNVSVIGANAPAGLIITDTGSHSELLLPCSRLTTKREEEAIQLLEKNIPEMADRAVGAI
jgi:hypothetical protein